MRDAGWLGQTVSQVQAFLLSLVIDPYHFDPLVAEEENLDGGEEEGDLGGKNPKNPDDQMLGQ